MFYVPATVIPTLSVLGVPSSQSQSNNNFAIISQIAEIAAIIIILVRVSQLLYRWSKTRGFCWSVVSNWTPCQSRGQSAKTGYASGWSLDGRKSDFRLWITLLHGYSVIFVDENDN